MRAMVELVVNQTHSSSDGYTLNREYGVTPNGNLFNGRWVYSDPRGNLIDFDQYRHDLVERNDLEICGVDYV